MERLEENYQDRDMIRCDDGNKVYLIPSLDILSKEVDE